MRIIKSTIFIFIFLFCVEIYLKNKKPTPYMYDSELGWTVNSNILTTKKIYTTTNIVLFTLLTILVLDLLLRKVLQINSINQLEF